MPFKVERDNSNKKLVNEKRLQLREKLNVKRHFTRNSTFVKKFTAGDVRKAAIGYLNRILRAAYDHVAQVFQVSYSNNFVQFPLTDTISLRSPCY